MTIQYIEQRVITNNDIVEIFRLHIPRGKLISVKEILKVVESNWELTDEDWRPHPSEVNRNHNYPSWKRKVQALLHTLKEKGAIQHFQDTHEYIL